MRQIAGELGVSPTTVSYALGQNWKRVGISPATRERILSKAREMGYRRNPIATSLRTQITKTIGVVVPALGVAPFGELLHGIESAVGADYTPLLGVSDYDEIKERRALESLFDRQVDGLIIVHAGDVANIPLVRKMQEFDIPVVQVDRHWPRVISDIVEPDNDAIGFNLTYQFIRRGFRHIHFLRSPHANILGTIERADGYARAMREARLAAHLWPPRPVVSVFDHYAFSYEQTQQLLCDAVQPLALVASDMSLLFGALRALGEAGLEGGKDFSLGTVVSNSSEPIYELLPACVTLAEWSVIEMGRLAGELLRQRMQLPSGAPAQFQTIRIPCRILERNGAGSHWAEEGASENKQEMGRNAVNQKGIQR
jgi:LacI family transcriptional regulator